MIARRRHVERHPGRCQWLNAAPQARLTYSLGPDRRTGEVRPGAEFRRYPRLSTSKQGPKNSLVPQFEVGCRYTVGAVDRLAMRSLICDRLLASISAGALPNSTHRQVQE